MLQVPSTLNTEVLWEETVHGGAAWSHVLKRGTALRITDLEGGANVPAVFYNFELPVERYNMPDTLKAQHVARLTKGLVLYSDMGRILVSVTGDTCGWHDPLGGMTNSAIVHARFGEARYQDVRNDCHRNTRDNLVIELQKYGLGSRDLDSNVNFFSKVVVDPDGSMRFLPQNSKGGDWVELRAEMNVLMLLDTGQHRLDPDTEYRPKPIGLQILKVPPASPSDECRLTRSENARGFILTERYFL